MSDVFSVLLLSLFGSVLALVGGVVFLVVRPWSNWLTLYSTPFAAGVLLVVALVGLLPESSHELGDNAFILSLGAFLTAFLFEHFFFGIHHHETHEHESKGGSIPLVIIGDTIHNFVDGVAIAAAYFMSPGLGLVTAASTFLHEVPHEIGDFGILLAARWDKWKIVTVNIISSLATVAGAFFIVFFTKDRTIISYLLAVASGIFLYLGASDFLPHVADSKRDRFTPAAVLLVGAVIMFLILRGVPHEDSIDNNVPVSRTIQKN